MPLQIVEEIYDGEDVDLTFRVSGQGVYLATVAKFSGTGTPSGDFQISLIHPDDADRNVVLESVDSSLGTDIVFRNRPFPLPSGYTIQASYTGITNVSVSVIIFGTDSILRGF